VFYIQGFPSIVLIKGDKQYKYRGMKNARSFAEFALNPFIHENALDIDDLPLKRNWIEHIWFVIYKMGQACSVIVESGFEQMGLSHWDFWLKATITLAFVTLPINLLLCTCCILSWELYKVKKEEFEDKKLKAGYKSEAAK
jgi:hypothetical protein